MNITGYVCDEHIFWHDNGSALISIPSGGLFQPGDHIENPAAKRRFHALVQVSGLISRLVKIDAETATRKDLERFHTSDYIDRLIAASERLGGGPFGELCYVGHGSYEIAARSAGSVIAGISSVLKGDVQNAYCVTRPSGHHAEPDEARGFCLIGNIPVAIHYAKAHFDINRIAVIDWDVHQGNGTEVAFYDDRDVLTISVHEANLFPFDGTNENDIGEGDGVGFNVNIPLPPGSGVSAYNAAFEKIIVPKIHSFKPDLIIAASGYDASCFDPMGHQLLPAQYFGEMTRKVMALADTYCDSKLLVVHEGGYSDGYAPLCGIKVLEQLSGVETDVVDPYEERLFDNPAQKLNSEQMMITEKVAALHGLKY